MYILLILIQSIAYSCPKYICAQSPLYCLYFVNNQTMPAPSSFIFAASACPGLQYCIISPINTTQPYCSSQKYALTGETCTTSDFCATGNCSSNVCSPYYPTTNTTICVTPYGCDAGYTCSNSICKQQNGEGEPCQISSDCFSYMVCNNAKCIIIGAVEVGKSSDDIWGCSTLYGRYDHSNLKYLCSSGPKLKTEGECEYGPNSCNYTSIVNINSSSIITGPCLCTKTELGKSICPKGIGDLEEEVKYVMLFIQKYRPKCHYSKPIICYNESYSKTTDYKLAYVSYMRITDYVSYIENSQCVQQGLNKEYWEYYYEVKGHVNIVVVVCLICILVTALAIALTILCIKARKNKSRSKALLGKEETKFTT